MQLEKLQHSGRNGSVKSIQPRWTEQYKKCVQYDFKCNSVYNDARCFSCVAFLLKEGFKYRNDEVSGKR